MLVLTPCRSTLKYTSRNNEQRTAYFRTEERLFSLSPLPTDAVSEKDLESAPLGYFIREGVLMRRWRPLTASASDVWRVSVVIMICYYRSFCKSFSAVATPLTD